MDINDNKIKDKIFIYLHICILNNWEEVTKNILTKINESGLINKIENIFLFVLGNITTDNLEKIKKIQELNPKYKIKSFKNEVNTYERLTLNQLLDDCKNKYENCKILYLHSKGITRYKQHCYPNIVDWVEYLLYYNVTKYEECLNALNECDTCSINFRNDKRFLNRTANNHRYHYSGNFWWANSDYIKTLNNLEIRENFKDNQEYTIYYLEPEMWICSKAKKCMCLNDSNIDHYNKSYKFDQYENIFNKKIVEL